MFTRMRLSITLCVHLVYFYLFIASPDQTTFLITGLTFYTVYTV